MTLNKFESEAELIRSVLEADEIIEIELVDETDDTLTINLIVTPDEYIQAYVRPLGRINYKFYPSDSTIIKLSFQKGETFKYNLFLTQAN